MSQSIEAVSTDFLYAGWNDYLLKKIVIYLKVVSES
jgi:hypothetical protein